MWARDLVSQSVSAFCTSSLQNISAVGSSHSFSKTVLFLSLALFGLVGSEHSWHLLQVEFGSEMGDRMTCATTLFYSDLFIIYKDRPIVKSFFYFW